MTVLSGKLRSLQIGIVATFAIFSFAAAASAQIRVACVGDSITYGVNLSGGGTATGQTYPAYLASSLGSGYNVQNYGVPGLTVMTVPQGNPSFHLPYTSSSQYTSSINFNPNIVIIMLGANDAWFAANAGQTWQQSYQSLFTSQYGSLIQSYKNCPAHPTVYVALCTRIQGNSFGLDPTVLNSIIVPMETAIAAGNNCPIINEFAATSPYGGFYQDGVHPTASLTPYMASAAYSALTAAAPSTPAAPGAVTATAGAGNVQVSWTAPAGWVTTYNVYRSTTAGGEGTTPYAANVPGYLTSFTDFGISNGVHYYYKVNAVNSAAASAQSTETSATPAAGLYAGLAFGSVPSIPGTISFVNYDIGGQALAYNDGSTWNYGGVYRFYDGVGIESNTDTIGNGYDVAWTSAGQWTDYTVNVSTAGAYTAAFRVASGGSGGTFHLANLAGTNLSGTVTAPGTGGWGTWTTVNATVNLPAGKQMLQLVQDSGGYNLNTVTFTSTTPQVPTQPTNLAATAANSQATLTWTASTGATSYNVYRGTTAGGESATPVATGVTGTTYTNTGLTNGTTYYYKVAGVNSVGTSTQSNEAVAAVTVPTAPSSLAAASGNAQASLTWTASTNVASYNVYRGTTAGGESATPVATGITGTSYTNTGLTNGATYYFKVAGVNPVGTSTMSNEASVVPAGPVEAPYTGTPAAVPGTIFADTYDKGGQGLAYNVTVANGTDNTWRTTGDGVDLEPNGGDTTTNGADLGWTAAGQWFRYTVNVATAGSYTVGFRVASGATGGTLHLQNAAGTNLSGTVTVPGTGGWQTWATVNATVTLPAGQQILTVAQDSSPNGWNLNYMTFTLNTPPAAPANFTATAGNAQIVLSWTASTGATSYNLYRSTTAGGEGTTAIVTGITGVTYTNTGLTNGTKYYYKVAAVNAAGTGAQSSEASATPASSGGVLANGNYVLTPQNATGSRLDANGSSTLNGTKVQIWAATGASNQKWTFTNEGSGQYQISPSYTTGLALDVTNNGTTNGTTVQLWAPTGATNQRWSLTAVTGGYTLTPQSAPAERLDVSGPSSANGTQIQIWQATGATNQTWAITPG